MAASVVIIGVGMYLIFYVGHADVRPPGGVGRLPRLERFARAFRPDPGPVWISTVAAEAWAVLLIGAGIVSVGVPRSVQAELIGDVLLLGAVPLAVHCGVVVTAWTRSRGAPDREADPGTAGRPDPPPRHVSPSVYALLSPGERVVAVIPGVPGAIVATTERVFVERPGRVAEWPYEALDDVHIETGWFRRYVALVPKGTSRRRLNPFQIGRSDTATVVQIWRRSAARRESEKIRNRIRMASEATAAAARARDTTADGAGELMP